MLPEPAYAFSEYRSQVQRWPPGFTWTFHRNPLLEGFHLLWSVCAGDVRFTIDGETARAEAGAFRLWRFNHHDAAFTAGDQPIEVAWVFFRARSPVITLPDATGGMVADPVLWRQLMARNEEALQLRPPSTAGRLAAVWLGAILAECGVAAGPARDAIEERLTDLARRIRSEPAREWTAKDIACTLGIGVGALPRVFRARFGCTLRDFLLRARVDAAVALVELSDRPLKQIAALTGFCDQFALSHALTKHTGRSPSRWRRQVAG